MCERNHTISVGAGTVHIAEYGQGPAVLLLNGLGYANWSWESLKPLALQHRLLMLENRGTGLSSSPPEHVSVAGMADDAAAAISELDLGTVHLLGFSMGGYIAIDLALRYPHIVDSLILTATSAGGECHVPTPATTSSAWRAAAGLDPAEFANQTMHLSFCPGWAHANTIRYEELIRSRLEHPTQPAAWASQYAACDEYLQAGARVESIDCPTTIVHGDQDRVVPVENGQTLNRRIPNSRLAVLQGRGHLSFIEDPATFMAIVENHLIDVASHQPEAPT